MAAENPEAGREVSAPRVEAPCRRRAAYRIGNRISFPPHFRLCMMDRPARQVRPQPAPARRRLPARVSHISDRISFLAQPRYCTMRTFDAGVWAAAALPAKRAKGARPAALELEEALPAATIAPYAVA